MALTDAQLHRVDDFIRSYQVGEKNRVRLDDYDPEDTGELESSDKDDAREWLEASSQWLADQQAMLAAQDRWSVLIVLQGRDAAGKDGTIRHVMSGINPQGCEVTSFKSPTSEELDHDFLWRYHRRMPAQGHIGIFNRSYYEEVLVVRVHPAHLESQKLHPSLVTNELWNQRMHDINAFEEYLTRNGVAIVKLFLNVSRDEQKKRFLKRLDEPEKHWKFSSADIRDRSHWDDYTHAYEEIFRSTSRPYAPWHIVPADNKWFTRLLAASIVVDRIARLELEYPNPFAANPEALKAARKALKHE